MFTNYHAGHDHQGLLLVSGMEGAVDRCGHAGHIAKKILVPISALLVFSRRPELAPSTGRH